MKITVYSIIPSKSYLFVLCRGFFPICTARRTVVRPRFPSKRNVLDAFSFVLGNRTDTMECTRTGRANGPASRCYYPAAVVAELRSVAARRLSGGIQKRLTGP